MDKDEAKWERIRDVLIMEGTGREPRISSTRTLFGIPSTVDAAIDAIVAEDEAKQRAKRMNRQASTIEADEREESEAAADPS